MHKNTLRTIIIAVVMVIAAIQVYPTIGWMALSDEAKAARIEKWKAEDETWEQASLFGDMWKGIKRWAQFDRDRVIDLGLDLRGGVHMVVGLDLDRVTPEQVATLYGEDYSIEDEDVRKDLQRKALQSIRRRMYLFGAIEPVITELGNSQIQIQLPGETDIDRARDLIRRRAFLTFHIAAGPQETERVIRDVENHFVKNTSKRLVPYLQPMGPQQDFRTILPEHIDRVRELVAEAAEVEGLIPEGKRLAFSSPPAPWDTSQVYILYLLDDKPLMTGEGLTRAVAVMDQERGGDAWQILFELNATAGNQFGDITEEHMHEYLAVVVDDVVESAPVIQGRITTSGSITGQFNRDEAVDLSNALTAGALPVPIKEEFSGYVGPTLGSDSIRKGVWSSVMGLVVVVGFMMVYYRMAGIIANVALVANALALLGAMAYFDATLTLPGIAGLILTIGMAVDANVLIYERIREELRNGRSLGASIENGFDRAAITILDANVTTIIAAAILLEFGSGPIQGFAITLMIGVCSSVFAALVVARALFEALYNRRMIKKLTMMSFFKPDSHIAFLKARHVCLAASGAAILIGMVAFGLRGEGNFGVDFTTGTSMIINFESDQPVPVGDVRARLIEEGFQDPSVTSYEQSDLAGQSRFLIRLSELPGQLSLAESPAALAAGEGTETAPGADNATETPAAEAQDQAQSDIGLRVKQALAPLAASEEHFQIEKFDTVGPAVGQKLKVDAFYAILYSMLLIIIYLWYRFELKFALGAMVALVHDVLITLGVFALTGRQISLTVVAAILTIIGYSLNDTIVVFDRIREDLKSRSTAGMSYAQIMDLSMNQTLSRTLLTSLTTLFVVIVLYFFGGAVINDFAFALLVGIVVGTYSSIYIASPVVLLVQKWWGRPGVTGGEESTRRSRRGRDKSQEAAV